MFKGEIIGRMGFDAVSRTNDQGKVNITFSLAHTEFGRDQQGNRTESTTWVNVIWYNDGGNLLQYLKRGAVVFVRGRIRVSTYQDKAGAWTSGVNIVASEVEICSFAKQEGEQTSTARPTEAQIFPSRPNVNPDPEQSDDLPF